MLSNPCSRHRPSPRRILSGTNPTSVGHQPRTPMTSLTVDIPIVNHITRRDRPDDQANGLPGSVALVTGGGRGIGQLVAAALAGEGAAVGIIARSRQDLD